ncbi:tape measure protein [Oceanobacillus neutriphilus]|uniref:Tape measure protein N-terminal domain-containing protein n=1 Tax=Oceanobacillus neutriphilus TaxID=531815 RepID=A0ABQ2NMP4_9BACI|nr:tape measure protein [Oceanobacillus neutriphilus]GGP07271.1 hypothetical protein GCM10011346_02590 [Oceanobacillus neutriphilus]
MADYTVSARLTSDAKGFQKGFQAAQESLANLQGKAAGFGKKFQNIGKEISKTGDALTNRITKPAVAATTALTGITLVKGFQRLTGIDTAQAKLMGLGHDAETVEVIMNSALESVKGTSYGMDAAATTAASAVAAGIEPGKELTRYLTLTGDAAAIAGDSLDGMGSIFNKVQTANRAYNGELQMLSDRGLPIYQWLAAEADTTADAVRDMAADGEISAQMFLSAIENNIGGAAKIMGENSFTAAVSNIGASISRIGANFLDAGGEAGGFFSTVKPLLTSFNESLGVVEDKAADLGVKFGEAFNSFLDKAMELKARFDELSQPVQNLILQGAAIGAAFLIGIGPALKIVGTLASGFGGLVSMVSVLISPVGLVAAAIVGLGVAFGIAMAKSEAFREVVFGAFDWIKNTITEIASTLGPILATMFDGAKDGVMTFADSIGDKLLGAFDVISTVVMTAVELISTFISGLVEGFQSAGGEVSNLSSLFFGFNPILSMAMVILQEFGPQIAEAFMQIGELVLPLLSMLGETLGQLAAAVIPLVMTAINTLIPIIMELGMIFMDIVTTVLPIVVDLFMQLVPIVMQFVEAVIGIVQQIMPLVSVLIGSLVPVLTTLIGIVMNIVQAAAPALIAILGAVVSAFEAIAPVAMAVVTAAVNMIAGIIAAVNPIIAFVGGIISSIISIIAPIISFVAGVISSIFSVISPITAFVSGIFSTVSTIITTTFQTAMSFISSAISSISGIISNLSGVVSGVFNGISSTISSIMSGVSSTITGVFTAIQSAWTGLQSFVDGVFSGIGSSVETLVGQVKGFVNGVIGGINSAIGLINKIPGVSIGKIPQLYRGTDDWDGGFARMNEGGRGELVMLPGGSQVIPHDVSMKYAREAGKHAGTSVQGTTGSIVNNENNVTIHAVIRNDKDIDRLARSLDERLGNLNARKGAAFGG